MCPDNISWFIQWLCIDQSDWLLQRYTAELKPADIFPIVHNYVWMMGINVGKQEAGIKISNHFNIKVALTSQHLTIRTYGSSGTLQVIGFKTKIKMHDSDNHYVSLNSTSNTGKKTWKKLQTP